MALFPPRSRVLHREQAAHDVPRICRFHSRSHGAVYAVELDGALKQECGIEPSEGDELRKKQAGADRVRGGASEPREVKGE